MSNILHNTQMETAYGITIEAVSSQKQGLIGDSHSDQAKQLLLAISRTESVIGKHVKIVKDYKLTGSRRWIWNVNPFIRCSKMLKTSNQSLSLLS
ncbi:MAG: hypothetical protein UZ22_OP11002000527 [Microgenomates bacterium OLB23]|nr:MAG: hypothetical protein UZ22_OP11002000527 [Microgenomates bacterium OLB23]